MIFHSWQAFNWCVLWRQHHPFLLFRPIGRLSFAWDRRRVFGREEESGGGRVLGVLRIVYGDRALSMLLSRSNCPHSLRAESPVIDCRFNCEEPEEATKNEKTNEGEKSKTD